MSKKGDAMKPRERVLAVCTRKDPDRIPLWCGASPEFIAKALAYTGVRSEEKFLQLIGDDFRRVYSIYRGPEVELANDATWCSPFGVQRHGYGYGQPMVHPLATAETVAEIEHYPWPSPDWADISTVSEQASVWKDEYAILGGEWSPFWHDAIDLLGHENLYYQMYDRPAMVEALFERITDYYYEVTRRTFEQSKDAIDIFFIGNDLGAQTGPLLSVELFKQFLVPSLKRLIDLGHEHGKLVIMHCCGGFRPLIPTMIEIGLDGLQALQPDCVGMESAALKRDFGQDLVLSGAIDSHNVLISGPSPQFVYEETVKVLKVMSPGGGYICSASHDYLLEETPVENVLAMFEACRQFKL
ncbi:MAG: uroporphyrinogen decarboxylase family protein [Sphaerochaetaceae bacterium]|jgi:uroporphyrinogen-III decarboxylase|nr:uroporphyrinogen decarboxylase family protein [Sphaerochaetaceae bacterium]MDD4218612.1 uroporphyrinogen decarboxylase family protein [Sphaerochaetaceae bacterium]MDY0371425.1 uroporphyrinogen decarboxylase family protein [Sphaerochaetaceae bacterium]